MFLIVMVGKMHFYGSETVLICSEKYTVRVQND